MAKSLMEYLDRRAFNYVTKNLNVHSLSRFTSIEQYKAILRRIRLVSDDIETAVSFLDETSPEALETATSLIDTLEKKLEVIRQSARFLTKLKYETRFISEESDISLIDLTKGTFNNVSYSVVDSGIVMDSINKIHGHSVEK